jgi:electron transport complex protein RnfA
MQEYILFAVSAILVNNILLIQYLGNCPFLGTSKRMDTAVGMAMAVVFVLMGAGVVTWAVEVVVLKPLGLEFIRTIVFILVIAALVQFVELWLKKSIPALYAGLGIFLPLITTNCCVLGVCLLNIQENYGFLKTLVSSTAYPMGFGFALILFAGVRERILIGRVPKPMQDTAIGLCTSGCMSLAFLGFKGMI